MNPLAVHNTWHMFQNAFGTRKQRRSSSSLPGTRHQHLTRTPRFDHVYNKVEVSNSRLALYIDEWSKEVHSYLKRLFPSQSPLREGTSDYAYDDYEVRRGFSPLSRVFRPMPRMAARSCKDWTRTSSQTSFGDLVQSTVYLPPKAALSSFCSHPARR